jgi:hypothetical protein
VCLVVLGILNSANSAFVNAGFDPDSIGGYRLTKLQVRCMSCKFNFNPIRALVAIASIAL